MVNIFVLAPISDFRCSGEFFVLAPISDFRFQMFLILLPPPEAVVIGRVCWLVHLLVCYADCEFSKSSNLIFMKSGVNVQHLCQIAQMLPLTLARSKFKIKNSKPSY